MFQFFVYLISTAVHALRLDHKCKHDHCKAHDLQNALSGACTQRIQNGEKAAATKQRFQRLQMVHIPQRLIRRDHRDNQKCSKRRDRDQLDIPGDQRSATQLARQPALPQLRQDQHGHNACAYSKADDAPADQLQRAFGVLRQIKKIARCSIQ